MAAGLPQKVSNPLGSHIRAMRVITNRSFNDVDTVIPAAPATGLNSTNMNKFLTDYRTGTEKYQLLFGIFGYQRVWVFTLVCAFLYVHPGIYPNLFASLKFINH
jgi:hypothetical protein